MKFDPSDEPHVILSIRNWADIELYMYVKTLFVEQGVLFVGI